jgi:hypothetical protein
MKDKTAIRRRSSKPGLTRMLHSIFDGPTATQNSGPDCDPPQNRTVKSGILKIKGCTPASMISYLFLNRVVSRILPILPPASITVNAGGMNDALRTTISFLPLGSLITKSGFPNGFRRLRPEGLARTPYFHRMLPFSSRTMPVWPLLPRSIWQRYLPPSARHFSFNDMRSHQITFMAPLAAIGQDLSVRPLFIVSARSVILVDRVNR